MTETTRAEVDNVQIRFFAGLVGLAGHEEETLSLETSPSTIGAVLDALAARHTWLAAQRPFVRVARNLDFVRDDDPVHAGDVVALLPPFSGG